MSDTIITLRSAADGDASPEDFTITLEEGSISVLINDTFEEGADGDEVIDIARAKPRCLEKIVEFLKHYRVEAMTDVAIPIVGNSFDEAMTQEWYRNFVSSVEQSMLFELAAAANFMGIKPLLDLACLKVTFAIPGKSPEEIRTMLQVH